MGKLCPIAVSECVGHKCAFATREDSDERISDKVKALALWRCEAVGTRPVVDMLVTRWRYEYVED